MLLNLLVLLLVLLIAAFFATQGVLSALLAFITAMFSSIMAMALMEPLERFVGMWKYDYARGASFLAVFVAVFGITRFAADIAVPGNIRLPKWAHQVGGGIIGLFVALIVLGTLIIGFEMLPLPRVLMGYDRFPGLHGIQAVDGDGKPELGKTAAMSGVWLGPDRFVQATWQAASGRSLGGSVAGGWFAAHPDISVESYGYRTPVLPASGRSVPPDLFNVTAAWRSGSLQELAQYGRELYEPGTNVVMVRTEVLKGDGAKGTADNANADAYFRISAVQVRLVTAKGKQVYPLGYLEGGRVFVPLNLESGHVVEDYQKGKVVEDWVFRVAEEDEPALIEMKQFGRKALAKDFVKQTVTGPAASAEYPQHAHLRTQASIAVSFDTGGKKLVAGRVYLLKQDIWLQNVASEIRNAADVAAAINGKIENGTDGWTNAHKPGVPDRSAFTLARTQGATISNGDNKTGVPLGQLLPILLAGEAKPTGAENLAAYPAYIDEKLIPLLKKPPEGSVVLDSASAVNGTNVTLPRVATGNRVVLVTLQTDRGFYIWLLEHAFENAEQWSFKAAASGGDAPMWKIDLDQ